MSHPALHAVRAHQERLSHCEKPLRTQNSAPPQLSFGSPARKGPDSTTATCHTECFRHSSAGPSFSALILDAALTGPSRPQQPRLSYLCGLLRAAQPRVQRAHAAPHRAPPLRHRRGTEPRPSPARPSCSPWAVPPRPGLALLSRGGAAVRSPARRGSDGPLQCAPAASGLPARRSRSRTLLRLLCWARGLLGDEAWWDGFSPRPR